MGESAELASIKFPQGPSRIPILAQSAVRPPRSTKPSFVPSFQKIASMLAFMNGDIPNQGLYPKFTEPPSPSFVPATQPVQCRPSFQVCGTFSGNDGIPAARWLQKLEQEFRIQDRHIEEV